MLDKDLQTPDNVKLAYVIFKFEVKMGWIMGFNLVWSQMDDKSKKKYLLLAKEIRDKFNVREK